MGNCLRHGSSDMVWAGEDWGCVGESCNNNSKDTNLITEKLRLLGGGDREMREHIDDSNSHHRGGKEVKIKISKRELEELVGVHGVPMSQLLSHLIINGHDRPDHGPHLDHQRSWRPVLQSIPENN